MDKHEVSCPYCSNSVKNDLGSQPWKNEISQILTVPVLERLGTLATTQSWVSKEKDTRLGGLFSIWNKTVGLLRAFNEINVRVMKRELLCDVCNTPFDCYVNLDKNNSFQDFWPHLTGIVESDGKYSSSEAMSFAEKIIQAGSKLGLSNILALLVVMVVFLVVSILPWVGDVKSVSDIWGTVIIRTFACLFLTLMIWTVARASKHLRKSFSDFNSVLKVSNYNSLRFWSNFTLGRLTGVRYPKVNDPKSTRRSFFKALFSKIYISQAAFVGGLPSVLIGYILWQTQYRPITDDNLNWLIPQLIFWLVLMFFTGFTAWIGFNVGVFVLENIIVIPMRISPFNGFSNISPVKRIARLSFQMVVPVALLPLLFIVALRAFPEMYDVIHFWLLPWIRIALGFGFILIGLGDPGVLLLGLAYIFLVTNLGSLEGNLLNQYSFGDEGIQLVIFGLFLSILLGYHLYRAFGPIKSLLQRKKQETIKHLDSIIDSLSQELDSLYSRDSQNQEGSQEKIDSIVVKIERVTKLRGEALSAKIGFVDLKTGLEVLSPIVSSILLPLIFELIDVQLFQK